MYVDEQLQTRRIHPCEPLHTRASKAIDLDRVYTDKVLNSKNCLPVQPVNRGPCKFRFMLTRVKRYADLKVYEMPRKLKSLHTLRTGTSFFVVPQLF